MAKDTEQKYTTEKYIAQGTANGKILILENEEIISETNKDGFAITQSNLIIANELSRLNDHLEDSEKRIENALKEGLKQGIAFAEKMEEQKRQEQEGAPGPQVGQVVTNPEFEAHCPKCERSFPLFASIPCEMNFKIDKDEPVICPHCGSTVEG